MNKVTRTACLTITLLLGSVGMSCAAHFDKGQTADQNGDDATALNQLKSSAARGNAKAQFNLGNMYHQGRGVPKDDQTALKWYRMAAEQGDAKAQFNLGLMYHRGQGVPKDYKEALKYYQRAAEQGLASAQRNLGLMYSQGQGVPKDYIYAYMWSNLAASYGDDEDARRNRANLAELMSSADLAAAQKRARECLKNNFKDC